MKTISEEATMVLTDLVKINNDRIKGYEKAIHELSDEGNTDLKAIFADMIKESHNFRNQLMEELEVKGENAQLGTSTAGKIYRSWMEIKSAFTGSDRKAILESCEYGEDVAQRAYETALEDENIPEYIREILTEQKHSLKLSHDQIKVLRNQNR
ncbi:PA2169 family four-helix-bundle protein [Pseudopedobacter sp.]|uniref:PA2169 family four-helix-bundle protein n=1 Tax=Pseudopedobacter sp. TaxID=1936787 RepID=UPI003341A2FD